MAQPTEPLNTLSIVTPSRIIEYLEMKSKEQDELINQSKKSTIMQFQEP